MKKMNIQKCGASLAGPPCNILFIDKIKLKEISNSEKEEKLKQLKERDYYDDEDGFFGYRGKKPAKKLSEEEIKNVIESLKYTHIKQELLDYSSYGSHHYFRGNVILEKNI